MIADTEVFNQNGFVKVNNLVDKGLIKIISQYFENRILRGEWKLNYKDDNSLYSYFADPLTEVILTEVQGKIEEVVGQKVLPTYSFARIYQPGEQLKAHVDRESCEISTTVSVAYKGDITPIYMQKLGGSPVGIFIEPGDAVVYKGCEIDHWRDVIKEDSLVIQFMLHYIYKEGRYSHFQYDKRLSLGRPNVVQHIY